MATEFELAIQQICEEKNLKQEDVISTIEAALAAAFRKDYGKKGQLIETDFDPKTGKTLVYDVKEVVEEKEDLDKAERQVTVKEGKKLKKGAKVGDIIKTEITPKEITYGRIAAQTAKQVIIQKIREAERNTIFDAYKNKEGEILNGSIQRMEGQTMYIDLGQATGLLFPTEQISNEQYSIGQRLKFYLVEVKESAKGPEIILSRSHPDMVKRLFELEVPEIAAGAVVIKALAREAGARTKIAVMSTKEEIDPIGACVGQRGTRVQTIIGELNGEKIDIISWDENPIKFITNSLSPAKAISVQLDQENKLAKVEVVEDQLSLAIGKHGQNVRLAVKLTGWKIDVIKAEVAGEEKDEGSKQKVESSKEEKLENSKQETENKTKKAAEEKKTDEKSTRDFKKGKGEKKSKIEDKKKLDKKEEKTEKK